MFKNFPKLLNKGVKISYYDPTGEKRIKKIKFLKSSEEIFKSK